MRRFWLAIFILSLLSAALSGGVSGAEAAKPVKLYLDGMLVTSESPVQSGGSTYVSVNFFVRETGAVAVRDGNTMTVARGGVQLVFTAGSQKVSGGGKPDMPAPARAVDGDFLVPLLYTANQFDIKSIQDSLTRSVFLYQKMEHISGTVQYPIPTVVSAAGGSRPSSGVKPGEKLPEVSGIALGNGAVTIDGTGKLEARVHYLPDPHRLVIDLPNSVPASRINGMASVQNGEVPVQHPLVEKVRYALFDNNPSTVRIVLTLKQKPEFELQAQEQPTRIVVSMQQAPPARTFAIVIDPGHGGHDPGAPTVSKKEEKTFNLSVSKKIYDLLKADSRFEPHMTRTEDVFVSLDDRVSFANDLKADLFLSIHGNVYQSSTVRGTETYYYRRDSLELAEMMHKKVVEAAGFPDRKVRLVEYKVLRETKMPAALLEIGYLSNPTDEAEMFKAEFQDRLAKSIVDGIKEYLGIS